jgi:hypothetical protein
MPGGRKFSKITLKWQRKKEFWSSWWPTHSCFFDGSGQKILVENLATSVANSWKDLPANFSEKFGRWHKNSAASYKKQFFTEITVN